MTAPVLLLHGLGGSHRFWEDVQPLLGGHAKAIDLPTHPSVAAKAEHVLSTFAQPHLVIGHSLGAMVAQEMALRSPDLVRGMVLANSIPGATERVVSLNTACAELVRAQGSASMAAMIITQLFGPEALEGTVRAKMRLTQDMSATPPDQLVCDLLAICGFDARDRLAGCRVPAFVLGGEHETNLGDQHLLAGLLGTKLVVLPGTGHMSPAEAPAAFVQAIGGFLVG